MDFTQTVIESITIVVILILIGTGLRGLGVLKAADGSVFAKIVTQYTLPALIFHALSRVEFEPEKLQLVLVMIVSQLVCAFLAMLISSLLKLSKPKQGALILGSTFTSSGLLGYAVVKIIYADNVEALSDAAIVSELGVATLFFTFGLLLAIHYGSVQSTPKERIREALKFFRSPIFIALVLGLAVSFIKLPFDNIFVKGFYRILGIVSAANTLMVSLTIGVMLHFKQFTKVLPIVIIVVLLKLIVQPLLSHFQAGILNFPQLWHDIVVLEASMPTAALTAVFAKRYKCDSELTTILVFATFISSVFTMVTMIVLLN